MILLLFVVWLVLSGDFSWAGIATGLLLSGTLGFLSYRIWNIPLWGWKAFYSKIPWGIQYIGYLICQIVKSNVHIAKEILKPGSAHKGTLVWFESGLQKKSNQVLLANSITLTPGTVTVSLKNGRLCVYCLHETAIDELKNSGFAVKLRAWEENDDTL